MTLSQPLRICDPCREGRHDECAENMTSMHEDSGPKVCWCVRCSWSYQSQPDESRRSVDG